VSTITIKGIGTFTVRKNASLLDVLRKYRVPINASCGGRGRCGMCRVRVKGNDIPCDTVETLLIPQTLRDKGYRLACRQRITHHIDVIVPALKHVKRKHPGSRAVALDLGTTIIKGAAVDLKSGRVMEIAKTPNLQNSYGGDVITRISSAMDGNYKSLRKLLLGSIRNVCNTLNTKNPVFTTVVGNPVMLSFYLNKSVKGLSCFPFTSELGDAVLLKNPNRYIFPIIGGFVGADTLAGLLASGVCDSNKTSLYMDIGTNGEVAIVHHDNILTTSTAAGPAFEGMGLSCGSLAIPGAIDRIAVKPGGYRVHTIGNKTPVGLCASGLVDLLGVLLKQRILRQNGRLQHLVKIGASTVTQKDIRALQLAVGALHAGIKILLDKVSLKSGGIDQFVLTGEFGTHINTKALFSIGLLPSTAKKIHVQKDLPLRGAIMALKHDDVLERIHAMRLKSKHIDLATQPHFQKTFISSLKFASWT
jgi:uncharacterized 2Fe-2S/4Fe-4S cluster protein (DUF4445 family)